MLTLMTDGEIDDMPATVAAVVAASRLPLSIIIVGVGSADFSCMVALDSDGGMLRSNTGDVAVRDIVQFVPFREYASKGHIALAADVLAEVPSQIIQYLEAHHIRPLPRKAVH